MRRNDIHKVLIIGSGPIIIGQACEFDYSGTQACKALRKLGYEIVLVNSNPATIMTDPETADVTYIEPLNVDRLTQIIEKERPDALLPNLGGQSGLNLCSELAAAGVLDKYDVKVIGVQVDAIERGEDRIEFKHTMESLGIEMARSEVAYSVEDALAIADKLGYPVVLRPAYTMGGEGGGLVYNVEELKTVCARGLQASMVGQVLVEESILGWEELELEVVRDAKNNMITVCFIENIDPLGVHTGDSFCSAPMLTISEEVQKRLQEKSYKIVEAIQAMSPTSSIVLVFSGRCGKDTVGFNSDKSMVYSSSYSASGSASYTLKSRLECSFKYSMVFSSTGKIPFLPPASIAMLQIVKRSSMKRFLMPSPTNSMERYSAPSTPIIPIM